MANILVADGDAGTLQYVQQLLQDVGHDVTSASDGCQVLEIIKRQLPKLLLLSEFLPELSGLSICRRVRADPFLATLPVLLVAVRQESDTVIRLLDAGADGCLIKPLRAVELRARVRAALRRASDWSPCAVTDDLVVGELRVDLTRTCAQIGRLTVELTSVEHRLLRTLMLSAGQLVSVERLLQDVWGYPRGVGDCKVVHVSVGRLRAKIASSIDGSACIHSVYGRGYLIGA